MFKIVASVFCALVSINAFSSVDYSNRLGLRARVGAAAYGSVGVNPSGVKVSIDPISREDFASGPVQINPRVDLTNAVLANAGVALPLELSLTYGITNALELALGFAYSPSLVLLTGNQDFNSKLAVIVGFRYYLNVNEPVKGYFSQSFYLGIPSISVQPETAVGLQYDVNDVVALFVDAGFRPLTYVPNESLQLSLAALLSLGAHFHF